MKPEDAERIKELLPTTLGSVEIRGEFREQDLEPCGYLSLERVFHRKRPRKNWPSRWYEAGRACNWEGALPYGTIKDHPMLALPNSPIWKELSKGRGGFRDCIGNGEPPFAYGSGLRWLVRIVQKELQNQQGKSTCSKNN